jgi:hypothetical protein
MELIMSVNSVKKNSPDVVLIDLENEAPSSPKVFLKQNSISKNQPSVSLAGRVEMQRPSSPSHSEELNSVKREIESVYRESSQNGAPQEELVDHIVNLSEMILDHEAREKEKREKPQTLSQKCDTVGEACLAASGVTGLAASIPGADLVAIPATASLGAVGCVAKIASYLSKPKKAKIPKQKIQVYNPSKGKTTVVQVGPRGQASLPEISPQKRAEVDHKNKLIKMKTGLEALTSRSGAHTERLTEQVKTLNRMITSMNVDEPKKKNTVSKACYKIAKRSLTASGTSAAIATIPVATPIALPAAIASGTLACLAAGIGYAAEKMG